MSYIHIHINIYKSSGPGYFTKNSAIGEVHAPTRSELVVKVIHQAQRTYRTQTIHVHVK